MGYRSYYVQKIALCNKLVSSKKKKITEKDVEKAAKELSLPYPVAERAWKNFVENSGIADKRSSAGNLSAFKKKVPVLKKPCTKSRHVECREAAKILLEFMQPKVSATMLSNKYNVSIGQIYNWVHELQVSGKLLGARILNPEKYSKPDVLVVIAYRKNPYSKAKRIASLSPAKRLNYARVGDILVNYLSAVADA